MSGPYMSWHRNSAVGSKISADPLQAHAARVFHFLSWEAMSAQHCWRQSGAIGKRLQPMAKGISVWSDKPRLAPSPGARRAGTIASGAGTIASWAGSWALSSTAKAFFWSGVMALKACPSSDMVTALDCKRPALDCT